MEVTPFSISKHLSDLVGRNVSAKLATATEFTANTRTACYTVEPNEGTAVVQLDLHLLASLAGIMIGYNPAEVDAQVRTGKLDENLTDAARELMNVLSAVVVSEGRAIFKGLFSRAVDYSARAAIVLQEGCFLLKLQVTPSGGKVGYMLIRSDT